jgi:multidrug transporter EmrE-like cation transporter
MTSRARRGQIDQTDDDVGWVLFATIILSFSGAFSIVDGIVALSRSSFYAADARYVVSDLRTWGWIILALGIAQLAAGTALGSGASWARWTGIGTAGASAIGQLLFAQSYPFWALMVFALNILVIYALAAHSGRQFERA